MSFSIFCFRCSNIFNTPARSNSFSFTFSHVSSEHLRRFSFIGSFLSFLSTLESSEYLFRKMALGALFSTIILPDSFSIRDGCSRSMVAMAVVLSIDSFDLATCSLIRSQACLTFTFFLSISRFLVTLLILLINCTSSFSSVVRFSFSLFLPPLLELIS
uniref:Uncharacterized protein n=1 Tax=Cacopsylla melanoneura TaxID=428564 RepID=A0A8D8VI01_9HEMI